MADKINYKNILIAIDFSDAAKEVVNRAKSIIAYGCSSDCIICN